jgi:hypothetical protein
LPIEARKLRMIPVLRSEAQAVFRAWEDKSDKALY